jgi:hypothetical protein
MITVYGFLTSLRVDAVTIVGQQTKLYAESEKDTAKTKVEERFETRRPRQHANENGSNNFVVLKVPKVKERRQSTKRDTAKGGKLFGRAGTEDRFKRKGQEGSNDAKWREEGPHRQAEHKVNDEKGRQVAGP